MENGTHKNSSEGITELPNIDLYLQRISKMWSGVARYHSYTAQVRRSNDDYVSYTIHVQLMWCVYIHRTISTYIHTHAHRTARTTRVYIICQYYGGRSRANELERYLFVIILSIQVKVIKIWIMYILSGYHGEWSIYIMLFEHPPNVEVGISYRRTIQIYNR